MDNIFYRIHLVSSTLAFRRIFSTAKHGTLDVTAAIELEINYLPCLTVHTRRRTAFKPQTASTGTPAFAFQRTENT